MEIAYQCLSTEPMLLRNKLVYYRTPNQKSRVLESSIEYILTAYHRAKAIYLKSQFYVDVPPIHLSVLKTAL